LARQAMVHRGAHAALCLISYMVLI
jgi:hypothetical protein